jgi:hypothetical protein
MVGAAATAICRFTPAQIVLLGVLRLSRLTSVLDCGLLPALLILVWVIVYAPIRTSRTVAEGAESR